MQEIFYLMKINLSQYIKPFITITAFVALTELSVSQEIGSNSLSREEITENLKSGNVLSYQSILDKIPREKEDRIIEAELVSYDGLLIYHLEILKENGIVEVHLIDGKTGKDVS